MKPIQYLGPLIKECRLRQGLTREHLCNRLSELHIDLNPDQLTGIEDETLRQPDHVLDALLDVIWITLWDIQQALREVEGKRGYR